MGQAARPSDAVPARPIERLLSPFERFLHIEAASGVVLFACTVVALAAANSPLAEPYQAFWDQHLRISIGPLGLDYPLWYWVNDALMTLFFFVIGLEIKRELVDGELSDPRNVVAPVAAAIGGAVVPVLIFLSVVDADATARRAWAVPMATDIAFVVGCLSLLGPRVPRSLKIFVLSLAIVDDILAVVAIAIFYSGDVHFGALGAAAAGFLVIAALNRAGVRTVTAYVIAGAVIWLFTLKSGIHPTIAGVALGLLTPASAFLGDRTLVEVLTRSTAVVVPTADATPKQASESGAEPTDRRSALSAIAFASREATSPLERLEAALHPWVGFVIMPVFALANANVTVSFEALSGPLALAIAIGLTLGKPVGILLATLVVVRSGLGALPEGTSLRMLGAASCLAGIGFTMALFVSALALEGRALEVAKGGVLMGSAASLMIGMGLLSLWLPRGSRTGRPSPSIT